MIHITQGHEKGIGLEVAIKSFLRLPQFILDDVHLYTDSIALKETLKNLDIPYQYKSTILSFGRKKVKVVEVLSKQEKPLSTATLEAALQNINEEDTLVTLPTSKDQLIYNEKICSGYTEFFRNYFKNENISMVFKGPLDNALLMTDHVPLNGVSKKITPELFKNKIELVIDKFQKYFGQIKEIKIAGINPHAGENGILGDDEIKLDSALKEVQKKYSNIGISDFLPGDTLHFHRNNQNQLLIFMYHDQGLSYFKERNGLLGLNLSFGLPFLRLSVDHGTAFDLYGKNVANCIGCLEVIKEAYRVSNHVHK